MRSIQTLRPTLRSAAVVLGSLLLAAPSLAGGFLEPSKSKTVEAPTYAAPAARRPVEGEAPDAWEAQLYNAKLRVEEAWQNADAARYNLTRARTRRYPRGEALQAMQQQTAELERERADAESEFSKVLQEARRAGVPAGIVADYMDFEQLIRQNQSARQQG